MPVTGSLMPISLLSGIMITRLGHFRWAIWTGWVVTATATGLLLLLDRDTKTYAWVLILLTVGVGHGFILTSTNFAVQALADASDSAFAASMYTFCRSFGMCIGVAVGGTVLQNRLAHELVARGLPVDIAAEAQGFIESAKSQNLSASFLASVSDAYVQSLKTVFEVLVGIAGLGLFVSLFIKGVTMNRALATEHVLRR